MKLRNSRRVRGLAASVPLSRSGLVQGLQGRLSCRHAAIMAEIPPAEMTPQQVHDRQRCIDRLRATGPQPGKRKSKKSREGKLDIPWAAIVRGRR